MVQKTTLPIKIRKAVQDYLRLLEKDGLSIQKAIVFGSHAKRKARRDSDIDICIISPQFEDGFQALHYLLKKTYEINAFIEPHPFHPKDFANEDPLVWEIKKTGVTIS